MLSSLDKKFNRILLKNKIISQEKSDEIIALSEKEKKPFIDLLIDKKVIDEGALLSALSSEVNIPPIVPEKIIFDEKIVATIPEKKAIEFNILAVSKIGNILTIAVSDPFDVVKLDDIRILSQCELRLVLTLERWL